jgi:gp16 family phage-associated protein
VKHQVSLTCPAGGRHRFEFNHYGLTHRVPAHYVNVSNHWVRVNLFWYARAAGLSRHNPPFGDHTNLHQYPMKKLRTASQARAWLDYQGISIAEWSREHNVPHGLVREILAGRKRCLRGVSHNIAVLLGMKDGVLTDRPARVPGGGRAAQSAQSAGATA